MRNYIDALLCEICQTGNVIVAKTIGRNGLSGRDGLWNCYTTFFSIHSKLEGYLDRTPEDPPLRNFYDWLGKALNPIYLPEGVGGKQRSSAPNVPGMILRVLPVGYTADRAESLAVAAIISHSAGFFCTRIEGTNSFEPLLPQAPDINSLLGELRKELEKSDPATFGNAFGHLMNIVYAFQQGISDSVRIPKEALAAAIDKPLAESLT